MATYVISIQNLTPDASGLVWEEPFSLDATNDNFRHRVWRFANPGTTQNKLYFIFRIPQNYVDTPVFNINWSCPGSATDDVVWDVEYRSVAIGESMDQTTYQEQLSVTDTDSATANERMLATVSATAGNFAAGDLCAGFLARDGSDVADDLGDDVEMHSFEFQYDD